MVQRMVPAAKIARADKISKSPSASPGECRPARRRLQAHGSRACNQKHRTEHPAHPNRGKRGPDIPPPPTVRKPPSPHRAPSLCPHPPPRRPAPPPPPLRLLLRLQLIRLFLLRPLRKKNPLLRLPKLRLPRHLSKKRLLPHPLLPLPKLRLRLCPNRRPLLPNSPLKRPPRLRNPLRLKLLPKPPTSRSSAFSIAGSAPRGALLLC